jgi:hypothetical protein
MSQQCTPSPKALRFLTQFAAPGPPPGPGVRGSIQKKLKEKEPCQRALSKLKEKEPCAFPHESLRDRKLNPHVYKVCTQNSNAKTCAARGRPIGH